MNTKQAPVNVAHVANFYNRYPGESVTFFTRLEIHQPVSGLSLGISIPTGLVSGDARSSARHDDALPSAQIHADGRDLIWSLSAALEAGTVIEYELDALVSPTPEDLTLITTAIATVEYKDTSASAVEGAAIRVKAKGAYLDYLPALYNQDELMGRLLMLFESFWKPVEGQIDAITNYFDPYLTPSDFLPWLASWMHLALDERWPEEKRRLLLHSAAQLYRMRGTKAGLQRYLEIYTGEVAEITERRASNFRLSEGARLGEGIALGRDNIPHTFDVVLQLPPVELPDSNAPDARRQRARKEAERRHTIEQIIESEKPAHTKYQLTISNEQ
ncbi:MAG: hypothetical protein B6243_02660 [Anaerolineaceae bacterium 4572_5.2]|nr:MAG: hypothetical protein B6243_02660 [Anaerolineaceae bacterium 4572_5.2]